MCLTLRSKPVIWATHAYDDVSDGVRAWSRPRVEVAPRGQGCIAGDAERSGGCVMVFAWAEVSRSR